MALQITFRGLFRCTRRILSIIFTIFFCDLLLRLCFMLLFFIMLPFFIIYDHVIPSAYSFAQSAKPLVDAFFGRLLPSLFAFVLSLLPPILVYYFTKHLLIPISIKIFRVTW